MPSTCKRFATLYMPHLLATSLPLFSTSSTFLPSVLGRSYSHANPRVQSPSPKSQVPSPNPSLCPSPSQVEFQLLLLLLIISFLRSHKLAFAIRMRVKCTKIQKIHFKVAGLLGDVVWEYTVGRRLKEGLHWEEGKRQIPGSSHRQIKRQF